MNGLKVLNLNAYTVRNQKTLIWLNNQDTSVDLSKWDGIVTDIASFYNWTKYNTNIVGIIIDDLEGTLEETLQHIFIISKIVKIVLISHKILNHKSSEYWAENFDNLIDLDTIPQQYPIIKTPWDGTKEDAVGIYATLCRYNRLVDCPSERSNEYIEKETGTVPPEIWLFTQYFKHSNRRRAREIKECLVKNCGVELISKVVLLNETDYSEEWEGVIGADKIQQVVTGKRLTYADFLRYVNDNVPKNVFVVLCNADIYFDNTLQDLWKINMSDRMFALLRWDDDGSGPRTAQLFGPRSDSHDAWIFLSDSIKSHSWNYDSFDFQLGQVGCDNVFAGKVLRNRFIITNPSLVIKAYHLHNSNIRNYKVEDFIKSDMYLNIAPAYIVDTKQEFTPKDPPTIISNEMVSFEVKSSSVSNEITYCTMLEKGRKYKWEPSIENHYFQPNIPVYTWKNAGVTPNGLVYDYGHIYKGKYSDKQEFNYWEDSNVNIFTPLYSCKRTLAIPFKNTDVFNNPDVYVLNYLSRCVRLLSMYPDSSFWIPREYAEYLTQFKWNTTQLRGLPFSNKKGVWAEEVVGFLPGPAIADLGKEDVSALRGLVPYWISRPLEKVCTVILGGPITREFVEGHITQFLLNNNDKWTVRYVDENTPCKYDAIVGSSLCIFVGGKHTEETWAKLWSLPVGCCVIEFQQELLIDGEFQHLAHVAEFKSWVMLLSKGTLADVQSQIMEQLERWFKKNESELFSFLSNTE
jgi:hypothetical protein